MQGGQGDGPYVLHNVEPGTYRMISNPYGETKAPSSSITSW